MDEDERALLTGHLRRSEQYRSWLARARQSVEKAKDRPAPYTLPRQISLDKQGQVDLLQAVLNDKLDDVAMILANKPVDANVTDSEGNSALLLAARNGNFKMAGLLLENGFKLDHVNNRKRTALMYAAKGGCLPIVKLMLSAEICDVDVQDSEGNTALTLATKRGHNSVVEALLASGLCDVSKQNKYGHTALHDAAKSGRMDLLAMIIFHGANKDVQDKWKSTPLMYATLHGHSNCVAMLVQSGCDVNLVNMGGRTALHTAAQNGHTNIVGVLLQADANMDIYDHESNTPVLLASLYQHYAIVKMLITKGCDVKVIDSSGKSLFHFISINGYADLVLHLLQPQYEINPDQTDKIGNTALVYAVKRNHAEVVEILLRKNCSVRRKCRIGGADQPIFVYALCRGFFDLLKPLADAGADVNCYDYLACQGQLLSLIMENQELVDWLKQISRTPKNLQRLCREKIREMLSCNIEDELERLTLPTKLKDYILMTA